MYVRVGVECIWGVDTKHKFLFRVTRWALAMLTTEIRR